MSEKTEGARKVGVRAVRVFEEGPARGDPTRRCYEVGRASTSGGGQATSRRTVASLSGERTLAHARLLQSTQKAHEWHLWGEKMPGP